MVAGRYFTKFYHSYEGVAGALLFQDTTHHSFLHMDKIIGKKTLLLFYWLIMMVIMIIICVNFLPALDISSNYCYLLCTSSLMIKKFNATAFSFFTHNTFSYNHIQ